MICHISCGKVHVLYFVYSQGIGDSGQGFTNAILFIFFTKNVRRSFVRFLCCKCRQPEEEATSSVTNPTYTSIQTATQSDDDDDDDDDDESKPFYVAALLEDGQRLDNKNQPV